MGAPYHPPPPPPPPFPHARYTYTPSCEHLSFLKEVLFFVVITVPCHCRSSRLWPADPWVTYRSTRSRRFKAPPATRVSWWRARWSTCPFISNGHRFSFVYLSVCRLVGRSVRPSVVGPSVGLRSMSYPLQFVCLHLVSIVFIFSFGAAVMSSTVVQHHLLVLLYQGLLFSAIWDTRRTASRPISTFSACNPWKYSLFVLNRFCLSCVTFISFNTSSSSCLRCLRTIFSTSGDLSW